jgi:hypothetical protein
MGGEHWGGGMAAVEDRNEELIQAKKRGYERGRQEAFAEVIAVLNRCFAEDVGAEGTVVAIDEYCLARAAEEQRDE